MGVRILSAGKGWYTAHSSVVLVTCSIDLGVRLYTRKDDVGVGIMCAEKGWFPACCPAVSSEGPQELLHPVFVDSLTGKHVLTAILHGF